MPIEHYTHLKGSLDSTVLLTVIATILHLFLWTIAWVFLTLKQNWEFKLRITVGRNVVRSARSIKLLNEVELQNSDGDDNVDAMMIVAFGKSFTVTDSAPKKLIMKTLTRAAIERDKVMEEGQENLQREQASRLNPVPRTKDASSPVMKPKVTFEDGTSSIRMGVMNSNISDKSRSPRLARSRKPQDDNGVKPDSQDICKSTTSPEVHFSSDADTGHVLNHFISDLDNELLPPSGHGNCSDTSTTSSSQHLQPPGKVVSPQPVTRKAGIQNPDVQDAQTPRSNRSMDSGIPQDDLTPRSDSFSTVCSSVSPPGQQQMDQHRKSNSLDEINLNNQNRDNLQWKNSSLQRGHIPAVQEAPVPHPLQVLNGGGNEIYASVSNPNGTVAIRRKPASQLVVVSGTNEEDPYGRSMNVQLTSFTEKSSIDPRITNLVQIQGPSVHHQFHSNFNTLPGQSQDGSMAMKSEPQGTHNTLPARVSNPPAGRHFRPFDHRKMNPMADIQEDPYGSTQNNCSNDLIVQHTNTTMSNMPASLRHTNYSSKSPSILVNPKLIDHRDSANFSMASSDSG